MTIPRLSLIISTLLITACSTQIRTVRLGMKVEPEFIPKAYSRTVKSSANTGDVMVTSDGRIKDPSGLRFEVYSVKESTDTSVKHRIRTFEFLIPEGDYRLHSKTPEGSYYSAPRSFKGLNGKKTGYGGLFVPSKATEATDIYWRWAPDKGTVYQAKLTSSIKGSFGEFTVPSMASTTAYSDKRTPEAIYTYAYKEIKITDTVDAFTDRRSITVIKTGSKERYAAWISMVTNYKAGDPLFLSSDEPEDSIGLRCDIDKDDNKTLMLTFDTGKIFNSTSSNIEVLIRIGTNEALKLSGKTYLNSYKSGYVVLKDKTIINQLKAEDTIERELKIRVVGSSSVIDRTYRMVAFVEKSENLLKACN